LLAASLCAGPAAARTWHLNPDGTGDAASVKAAAAAAATGDTLELAAGTFSNDATITIYQKTLLVKGAGQAQTILEGPVHGNIVYIQGPNNDTELRDLTIRGGHADVLNDPLGIGSDGGGVHAEEAYFTLRRVRITECTAGAGGGLGGAIFMTSVQRVRPGALGTLTRDRLGPRAAGCRTAGGALRPFAPTGNGYILIDDPHRSLLLRLRGAASAPRTPGHPEHALRGELTVDGGGLRVFDSFGNVTGCTFLNNHAEFYGGGLRWSSRWTWPCM
jgi:hypothetical protein